MGIDEKIKLKDELHVTVYLTSAPATSTFRSSQDRTEHRYKRRKALLVEYDTLLEETLRKEGVEEKKVGEIALLFASGAEHVSFNANNEYYRYRRVEDHATISVGHDFPKDDTETRVYRKALVRTITYQRREPDKDGRY